MAKLGNARLRPEHRLDRIHTGLSTKRLTAPLTLLLLLLMQPTASAGGIRFSDATLRYNGAEIELCSRMDNYAYSNKQTRLGIAVIVIHFSDNVADQTYVWTPPRSGAVCVALPVSPGGHKSAEVSYFQRLEFTASHFAPSDRAIPLERAPQDVKLKAKKILGHGDPDRLGVVRLTTDEPSNIRTYLLLNGATPAINSNTVPSGVGSKPLVFSWYSKGVPKSMSVRYRYRIYPTQLDWSNWSNSRSVPITLIPIGIHVFELQVQARTKYREYELPTARYQFTLEQQYVGPAEVKGLTGAAPTTREQAIRSYNNQRALLIGVTTYDKFFYALPFVQTDVDRFAEVLRTLGFKKDALTIGGRKIQKSRDILSAIDRFLKSAKDGDQLIVYLSGHGFSDDESEEETRAYFAGSDCDRTDAVSTCVSISEVKDAMIRAVSRKRDAPRHVLLVIDACAAGRAIVAKGFTQEISLARERAVHIVTAGTKGEEAHADRTRQMSVFTRYLIDGLKGSADIVKDDVISLSELMVWVRWQVAQQTSGTQTPSFARVKGAGEMMFPVPRGTP